MTLYGDFITIYVKGTQKRATEIVTNCRDVSETLAMCYKESVMTFAFAVPFPRSLS